MSLLDKYRIVTVPDSCGGTLTAASITGLTPDRFAAMAKTEYNLARVIGESLEARAVGVVPRALTELLMSRITEIGKGEIQKRKVAKQSIVMPFTYRRRKTNIASDNFSISAGVANAHAGTTYGSITYPASAWDVTVTTGPSPYASSLTDLHRYFLPGQYVFVENSEVTADAGSQTAYMLAFKVIAAATVAGDAIITLAPNYTAAGWTALSTDQKTVYQPTFGVVTIGANSINDMESWCYNEVAENSHSLITDWHQTSRYSQCHNDKYDEILKEITDGNVNDYVKAFDAYLPLAEQNKKQRLQYDKKWMASVFYGQRVNELQSPETYDQLPQVVDPDDGTVYEYKANALGLRTLLANEQRVVDAAGGPLDLDLLFQIAYDLKRNREVDGSSVSVIDFMTDKDTANVINIVLLKYLRDTFGYNVTQFYQPGKVLDATGVTKFTYNRYDIPGLGFQIAVFVDQYFTDRVTQFSDGSGGVNGSVNFKSRGRAIWAIDWSDFDIGIVATNSATREYRGETYANANSLYSCVITPNTKHYELRSTTWTTRLGDAKRSSVIENFDISAQPTLTLSVAATWS